MNPQLGTETSLPHATADGNRKIWRALVIALTAELSPNPADGPGSPGPISLMSRGRVEMLSITKTTRVGVLAAMLSVLAPLAFASVLARRALWRRGAKLARVCKEVTSSEMDRWRHEYSLWEFWTGEVKKHRHH